MIEINDAFLPGWTCYQPFPPLFYDFIKPRYMHHVLSPFCQQDTLTITSSTRDFRHRSACLLRQTGSAPSPPPTTRSPTSPSSSLRLHPLSRTPSRRPCPLFSCPLLSVLSPSRLPCSSFRPLSFKCRLARFSVRSFCTALSVGATPPVPHPSCWLQLLLIKSSLTLTVTTAH